MLSIASPSALWSTQPPINRSQQALFIQTGLGAWNLTLSARPAFCFYQPFLPRLPRFSLIDPDPNAGCPTRQEPIPTFRSSDGCLILQSTKSARRFALFAECCPYKSLSPAYPHIQLFAECLLSLNAMTFRLVIRTWLPPRTLTLPNRDSIFQGLQPSVGLSAYFTRPAVAIVMPSSLRNLTLFDQPWSRGLSYGDRLDPCTSTSPPVLYRRPHY